MERELKKVMIETMEAEERSNLFEQMSRKGLVTGAVVKAARKQQMSRKSAKSDNTEELLMGNILRDSRREEKLHRKEKKKKRKELEDELGKDSNKYRKILKKLKEKVSRIRKQRKEKNKSKIETGMKKLNKKRALEKVSSLPEECSKYSELRAFRGEEIIPEPPKPPVVTSPEIILTQSEINILSKSPKFTLRNVLDKTQYMIEVEKGLVKEKISRIGKEEENGKVIEEKVEDQKSSNDTQWLEKKSTLIYDMEEEVIDFGNSRPTNWAGNKRIYLPKGGSTSLESYLEIRRAEASKMYDMH